MNRIEKVNLCLFMFGLMIATIYYPQDDAAALYFLGLALSLVTGLAFIGGDIQK